MEIIFNVILLLSAAALFYAVYNLRKALHRHLERSKLPDHNIEEIYKVMGNRLKEIEEELKKRGG